MKPAVEGQLERIMGGPLKLRTILGAPLNKNVRKTSRKI